MSVIIEDFSRTQQLIIEMLEALSKAMEDLKRSSKSRKTRRTLKRQRELAETIGIFPPSEAKGLITDDFIKRLAVYVNKQQNVLMAETSTGRNVNPSGDPIRVRLPDFSMEVFLSQLIKKVESSERKERKKAERMSRRGKQSPFIPKDELLSMIWESVTASLNDDKSPTIIRYHIDLLKRETKRTMQRAETVLRSVVDDKKGKFCNETKSAARQVLHKMEDRGITPNNDEIADRLIASMLSVSCVDFLYDMTTSDVIKRVRGALRFIDTSRDIMLGNTIIRETTLKSIRDDFGRFVAEEKKNAPLKNAPLTVNSLASLSRMGELVHSDSLTARTQMAIILIEQLIKKSTPTPALPVRQKRRSIQTSPWSTKPQP